jgi:hypothetical protein
MNKPVETVMKICGSGTTRLELLEPVGMAKLNGNLWEWYN